MATFTTTYDNATITFHGLQEHTNENITDGINLGGRMISHLNRMSMINPYDNKILFDLIMKHVNVTLEKMRELPFTITLEFHGARQIVSRVKRAAVFRRFE